MAARPAYVWTGSVWEPIGPTVSTPPTYVQATAPSSPVTGTVWLDTSTTIATTDPIVTGPAVDQTITAANATTTPLIIKGASGQTDNFFEVKDNSNNLKAAVKPDGSIFAGRVDATNEGGEIGLARSTDNTVAWQIDSYGSTSTPSLRMIDNTAAAVRMSIDGSGRVTKPYQPFFKVTLGQDQTYTGSGAITFTLTGIKYNVGSHYSSATGRFTAPVSGYYYFSAGFVITTAVTTFLVIELLVNGVNSNITGNGINTSADASSGESGVSASDILYLNANDYVQFNGYRGASVNIGVSDGAYSWQESRVFFTGYLLG